MTHEELTQAGCTITSEAHALISQFIAQLLDENTRVNLTAVRNPLDGWKLHVLDSLAPMPHLARLRATTVADLGCGGGLPGIPLACALPQVQVTLIDSTRKKIAAVEKFITALGLSNAVAIADRAETIAHNPAYREKFDVVTARAVAALPVLLEYAAGLVRYGGHCIFFKSVAAADTEREEAAESAKRCRLTFVARHDYVLPDPHGTRCLLIYQKTDRLDAVLPRPAASGAKLRPLAKLPRLQPKRRQNRRPRRP